MFLDKILSLPPNFKLIIALSVDSAICIFSTWIAFTLILGHLVLLQNLNLNSVLLSILIFIPVLWLLGMYNTIFRYTEFSTFKSIILSVMIYGSIYSLIIVAIGLEGVPWSIGVVQPLVCGFGLIFSRLGMILIFNKYYYFGKKSHKRNLLVYGAGSAGRQLVVSLQNSLEYNVIGLVDDNIDLQNKFYAGKRIYSPTNISNLVFYKKVDLILLAMPSVERERRSKIISFLSKFNLNVRTLPSLTSIFDNKLNIFDIKDFNVEDLLDREVVKPNFELLNKNIQSKAVLVSGAGGSIGSELCRQILKLKPEKLVLLELNEFSLYRIYEELSLKKMKVKIYPLLLNINDQNKIELILEVFKVNTVYHAAAYKHVPLVEENICAGVLNNVFGTLAILNASIRKKISNFVLISTDKAVRPSNVMGASKRVAEMCVQGIYNDTKNIKTNCTIVRFGNVLESSGSLIPKIKNQIKLGGPVTLTHSDVTRYFMTITEAAQLVIQAGAMGKAAEVYVLDMGKSVKIKDLIYKIILFSGLTVKDDKNSNGDIEIVKTGLRPGEKLYEELLIGDNPEKTNHKKIYKAKDPFTPFQQLKKELNVLYNHLTNNNTLEVKTSLAKIVKSYSSDTHIVDHIFKEQIKFK